MDIFQRAIQTMDEFYHGSILLFYEISRSFRLCNLHPATIWQDEIRASSTEILKWLRLQNANEPKTIRACEMLFGRLVK